MKRPVILVILLGIACALSCASWSPSSATIQGVVYTIDGAPLPGVNVTLTGPGGSPTIITVTDENGKYLVAGIPAGLYEVTTELQGFTTTRQKVTVTTGVEEPVITKLRFVNPLAAAGLSTT